VNHNLLEEEMEDQANKPEQAEEQKQWKEAAYQSSIMPPELPPEVQAKNEEPPPVTPAMSRETKLGLSVLGVALVAGVAGDALLRATPWGVNVPAWILLVVGAVALLGRRFRAREMGEGKWLAVPVVFFAACFAWRDSATLNLIAALALLVAAALAVFRASRGRLAVAGLMEYFEAGFLTALSAIIGVLPLVFSDVKWREVPRDGWSRHVFAVGRGLMIAAPLLLLFGGLLAAADAVFSNILADTFSFDVGRVVLHTFIVGLVACLVVGYLRALLISNLPGVTGASRPAGLSLGIVEIGTALGLLDLLFLAFVAVQFRYFFFGAAHFPPGAGRAYAEYARSGFFELVTVTALVLPLLLVAHWLLRKDEPRNETIYRALAGAQVALLFVIMASAVKRMRLYQIGFGMTELRLYTMAFMGWLALVFVWFALTVLRGRRERFAFGAALTGFVMVAALHVFNPDDFIVRVNLERAREGLHSDLNYTTSLSADSVPALAAGLPGLSAPDRQFVVDRLRERGWLNQSTDWRSWNWARWRAGREMRGHQELMRPPQPPAAR
jgi:hypothetical protein